MKKLSTLIPIKSGQLSTPKGQSPAPYGAGQSPVPYGTGQSLIEVLISLSIATAVLSAITVAVVYSLRNTNFSKNQNLATQYAAEGMEVIRQIRDTESSLDGYNGGYCLPQGATTLNPTPVPPCGQNVGQKDIIAPTPPNVYIYSREVKIEPPPTPPLTSECGSGATTYKVTVKVLWWDNACGDTSNFCHKTHLISCLSDSKNTLIKP